MCPLQFDDAFLAVVAKAVPSSQRLAMQVSSNASSAAKHIDEALG
jgi:hypothetical protein